MKFAKVIFLIAGIYGLLVLLPQYFMEEQNGRNYPPPITHPEYYYGFVGVAVAWQVLFLILAKDPLRYRPMMLPAVLEKLGFGVVAVILYMQHRLSPAMLAAGSIDLILAALFVAAYIKTAAASREAEQMTRAD
ncbi:MAG: hypothetical protein QOG71_3644 [Pyrinomonadaceae bacterium]|nr:hypothetical protein [Pyrinomonadaceae bacterium]